EIVHEDDLCVVLRDINPQAPTHLLVVPRKPIPKLSEARAEDEPLLGHLMLVAELVAREQGADDWRLVVNNGTGAGQTVFHLHLHVMAGRQFSSPSDLL